MSIFKNHQTKKMNGISYSDHLQNDNIINTPKYIFQYLEVSDKSKFYKTWSNQGYATIQDPASMFEVSYVTTYYVYI